MDKKKRFAIGTDDSDYWQVSVGQKCEIVKDYFYNGETWYKLKREDGTKFDSPTVFWNEING